MTSRAMTIIQETLGIVKEMKVELEGVRADNKYIKEQLRAVKRSTMRKYTKKSVVEKLTGKKDEG